MQYNGVKIEDLKQIALEAGKLIMKIYNKDFDIYEKEDNSPLTQADLEANEIICNSLKQLYPNIPIMSEENNQIPYEIRKDWEYYFCIDPIDGTKEFIKKNGEFTVNIALIHNNSPVLGVVYAPVLNEMYYSDGKESFLEKVSSGQCVASSKKKLPFTTNDDDSFTVVASKSHLSQETQKFIDDLAINYPLLTTNSKGSSLKLCMVATGEADTYPRLAPTMEWDTAAADAVVRSAGKMTYQYESNIPVVYNKEDLLNPWFIVK